MNGSKQGYPWDGTLLHLQTAKQLSDIQLHIEGKAVSVLDGSSTYLHKMPRIPSP